MIFNPPKQADAAPAPAEQPAQGQSRTWFVSIRARLVLAFTLLATIVFAGVGLVIYNFASARATDRLVEDLTVLLQGTVSRIDGDAYRSISRFGTVDENGYPTDPRFWRLVGWLATIKDVDSRTGVYTISLDKATSDYYIVASAGALTDPTADDTARFRASLGTVADLPDEFNALFDGRSTLWLLLEPYQDDFGYWISGYITITDSLGEPVGVLGIDYEANYLYEVREQILAAGIPLLLGVYATFILVIITLITRFMRPLKTITNAAERIGDGEYDTALPKIAPRFQSEMDILSEVFGSMVKKLDRRETELRRQVQELKIEVDQAKASAQVSEIVDTDFFASLQQKARNIRNRRDVPGDTAGSGGSTLNEAAL